MLDADLLSWDRQIRLLSEFEEIYDARLKRDPDSADPSGPFIRVPPITEREAFVQLRALPIEMPIRGPLERWMFRLADSRVNAGLNRGLALYFDRDPVQTASLKETNLTRAELLRRSLRSGPARQEYWLALGQALSDAPSSPSELWQRRDELARRAGFEGAAKVLDPVAGMALLLGQWRRDTDAMAADVVPREPLAALDVALATGANQGWPVHISAPSIATLLGERSWLRLSAVKEPRWPELVRPASFARALHRFGQSLARAWAPEDHPFVIAHDPWNLDGHRMGALVSSLVLNESWHVRVLGLSKDQARMQVRAFAQSTVLASRGLCLKIGLRTAAMHSPTALRDAFAELSDSLLGFELPPSMAGYVPRIGRCDAQRLLGLWLGVSDHVSHLHTFDEDWYRDPKAIESLRGQTLERPTVALSEEQISNAQATALNWLSICLQRH